MAQNKKDTYGCQMASQVICDKYILLADVLGRGTFGEIRKGVDTSLEREVAIKIVKAHTPDEKRNFKNETIIMRKLGFHPHVIELWNSMMIEDEGFIVLPLFFCCSGSW